MSLVDGLESKYENNKFEKCITAWANTKNMLIAEATIEKYFTLLHRN